MTPHILFSLLLGWTLDLLLGDPVWLPHPVVWFGRIIARLEHRFNRGTRHRRLKGGVVAVSLVLLVFLLTWLLLAAVQYVCVVAAVILRAVLIFFCLAGTTLIREVRQVFEACDRSLGAGRRQVARIVGRDTSELSSQEVRTAALETLAENLSDGVIAPLFWLAVAGVPGMMAYKMVNTLDSMIGYRTERYQQFGTVAARIDDVANYLPARLTALLMLVSATLSLSSPLSSFFPSLRFVWRYGRCHASPNSGWPEAALAAILDCRFGGPHRYFGELMDKPFIGSNDRPLTAADMRRAVRINRVAELLALLLVAGCCLLV